MGKSREWDTASREFLEFAVSCRDAINTPSRPSPSQGKEQDNTLPHLILRENQNGVFIRSGLACSKILLNGAA